MSDHSSPVTVDRLELVRQLDLLASHMNVGKGLEVWVASSDHLLIRRAADALRGLAQTPWQPIETAPKDGTPALFCHWTNPEQDILPIASGFWSRLSEGWFCELSGHMIKPTHWMPLPAPPSLVSSTHQALPASGRLTFCERCEANRIHLRAEIVNGVQTFECPVCTVTSTHRAELPFHQETMTGLDALTIRTPVSRPAPWRL